MKKLLPVSILLCAVAFGNAASHAVDTSSKVSSSPLPDILKALGGHWTVNVKFEAASGLPPGTQGVGEESWRPTAGGKALLSEESWKAGPVDLSLLGVVWWNYR